MQRELIRAKEVAQRDPDISTTKSLIDLVSTLEIHIQLVQSVINGWDHALTMIIYLHKTFLDKYGLTIAPQQL